MTQAISTPELANRLARTIASDIALYNEEKIMQGFKNDSLFDDLADEIKEGRELYRARVSNDIFERENFFDRALVDVIFKAKGEQVESHIW